MEGIRGALKVDEENRTDTPSDTPPVVAKPAFHPSRIEGRLLDFSSLIICGMLDDTVIIVKL